MNNKKLIYRILKIVVLDLLVCVAWVSITDLLVKLAFPGFQESTYIIINIILAVFTRPWVTGSNGEVRLKWWIIGYDEKLF